MRNLARKADEAARRMEMRGFDPHLVVEDSRFGMDLGDDPDGNLFTLYRNDASLLLQGYGPLVVHDFTGAREIEGYTHSHTLDYTARGGNMMRAVLNNMDGRLDPIAFHMDGTEESSWPIVLYAGPESNCGPESARTVFGDERVVRSAVRRVCWRELKRPLCQPHHLSSYNSSRRVPKARRREISGKVIEEVLSNGGFAHLWEKGDLVTFPNEHARRTMHARSEGAKMSHVSHGIVKRFF